jgi:nucleoside-diphosphate-sugar epimerase
MVVGITGASGFIGSALVRRHLQAGHVVRALTRQPGRGLPPGVQPFEGDLERSDERLVRFADGLDILYHCAGELVDERRMEAVNVGGVRTLLRAADGRIGRWVQLSSAGVYGRHRSGVISEETAPDPRGIYERTKADADALVMDAARRGAVASCTILRPSIVFGPAMPNESVRQMIRVIRRGLFFFIGARGASANYVHIDNVVDALVACGVSAQAAGRVYILSDWCTVEDFVAAIADALGRPRPRLRLPEPPVRCAARLAGRIAPIPLTESRVDALVTRSRYSVARLQQELRYVLRVTIPDGLAQMVEGGRAA